MRWRRLRWSGCTRFRSRLLDLNSSIRLSQCFQQRISATIKLLLVFSTDEHLQRSIFAIEFVFLAAELVVRTIEFVVLTTELVVRTTKLLPPKTGLKQRASAVILQRTLLLVVPPWPIVVLQLLHRQLLLQLVRIQLRVLPTAVVVVILFLQPIFPTDWILLANPK